MPNDTDSKVSEKEAIARNLTHIMEEKGVSNTKLAKALGIGENKTLIAYWKKGKYTPRPETLIRIAEALGCTVRDLKRQEQIIIPYGAKIAWLKGIGEGIWIEPTDEENNFPGYEMRHHFWEYCVSVGADLDDMTIDEMDMIFKDISRYVIKRVKRIKRNRLKEVQQ